jgi:FHA domain-containing protein
LERKGEDFLALQQYVQDKATLLERLAQMEEKRDKIKKAIFEKIKADYDGKLRKLIDDFRPVRIRIIQKLSDFEQELAQIEKKLSFAQDKVIELRFRHQLGEYGEDEFRRMEYDHLAQVDNIQASWDELNADLEDYRNLVGDDKDFQRRYAPEEPAAVEAVEEYYAGAEGAPDGAQGIPVSVGEETPAVERAAGPREPVVSREPAAPGRESVSSSREVRSAGFVQDAAGYEETEEPEEGTESTHDTALMDDEELFGRYYKDQEADTAQVTEVDAYQETYSEDESGTMEMAADVASSAGYSTEDSSTGVWSADAILPAVPPPVAPPVPSKGAGAKVPASFLETHEEDDDKDSTMVWGGGTAQEVQAAAASTPANVLVFRDRKNNKDVTFTLGKAEVSIGRSQDNDIVLTEGKISRRHAKVQFSEGGFLISDLNSSNGTFVNGKKITRPVLLHEDDEILIGDSSMKFR